MQLLSFLPSFKNKLFLAGIFMLSATFSLSVQAQGCSYLPGGADRGEAVTFPNVVVSSTAPLGTVLATVHRNGFIPSADFITCDSVAQTTDWRAFSIPFVAYNGEWLLDSGVMGVAVRVVTPGAGSSAGRYSGSFNNADQARMFRNNPGCTSGAGWRRYCGDSWGPVTFELVKIGNMSSAIRNFPARILTTVRGYMIPYTFTFLPLNITVTNPTCSISINPVNMGHHNLSDFSNTPSTNWINFDVTSAGCSADVTRLRMQFNGTADSNNSNLFALAPGGASGVGVELQKQDGTQSAVPNSSTALLDWAPVAIGGAYPMRARYTKTLPTVTPGVANGVVTVDLTYN